MNNIHFNEHRPVASITDLAERLRDKSYSAGRRDGLAQLEQSTKAAREEGVLIGLAMGEKGKFVHTLVGVCIGVVIAVLFGPFIGGLV